MYGWNTGTCFENAIALSVTVLAMRGGLTLAVVVLVASLALGRWSKKEELNRKSFPQGFIFGTASSAYQNEGAAAEGGRGPSVWDTFTHDSPGGNLRGGVNQEGITYYNNLINELLSNGLQPFITLFHWDSPQALEDEYGGFLSPNIVDDFRDFANTCFKEFGDRVKHWITLNEPLTYSTNGYATGEFAPGRCSKREDGKCSAGNSATEPYIVSHHLLLAHAAAVKIYREKYQASQNGKIGITFGVVWMVPLSASKSDENAAHRLLDFTLGWYMEPLVRGKYPFSMRSLVGDRLPSFTKEQAHMVKGSFDFIGLNYYTALYATDLPLSNSHRKTYVTDANVTITAWRNGIAIGRQAASRWLFIYPQGFRDLLVYFKERYQSPIIYITENGVDEFNNKTTTLEEALRDDMRIDFYREHLTWLHKAIREGVDVRGYFAWTLLDNFEWSDGYTVRFGINYVDFDNGLKRYPKHSAHWFKKFLKGYRHISKSM
ncbi:beta-glucosidase 12 isoform X1 [Cinnamomum micranthum f. kanehirae]|uniref:Beta-glucosidase 12 isoform X1 n=1 Tax=Cinnamomum micranthum f. kanehirae TaxID=337451 RepID=A0A443NH52_9MAGN|nr:beta-glucosidase 12 isoform X1 [Cinnamomum micranthum f. kanehirae]